MQSWRWIIIVERPSDLCLKMDAVQHNQDRHAVAIDTPEEQLALQGEEIEALEKNEGLFRAARKHWVIILYGTTLNTSFFGCWLSLIKLLLRMLALPSTDMIPLPMEGPLLCLRLNSTLVTRTRLLEVCTWILFGRLYGLRCLGLGRQSGPWLLVPSHRDLDGDMLAVDSLVLQ